MGVKCQAKWLEMCAFLFNFWLIRIYVLVHAYFVHSAATQMFHYGFTVLFSLRSLRFALPRFVLVFVVCFALDHFAIAPAAAYKLQKVTQQQQQ